MEIILIVIIGILLLAMAGINRQSMMYKRLLIHNQKLVEVLRKRLGDIK